MCITGGGVLVQGKSYNRADLVGHQFGHLTVVEYVRTTKDKKAIWRCVCVCGRDTYVTTNGLRSGNTKSCGCGNTGRLIQKGSTSKVCRRCGVGLVAGVNHRASFARSHNWVCNTCNSEYHAELLSRKPNRNYESNIKRKYGISGADYTAIHAAQEGKCAICGVEAAVDATGRQRLYVDHCHDSGKVRGLLCKHCNVGLGNFRDSIDALLSAVRYLQKE